MKSENSLQYTFIEKHPVTSVSLFSIGIWLLLGATMPVVQDEAYYFMWSEFLGAGFFDHPPFVALVATTHNLASQCILISRLGNITVACLTLLATIRFFRVFGLRDKISLSIAVCLSQLNFLGLIGGFLTTPDTGLMLFWVLAVTESMLAIQGQRPRWLLAGLFTGLGIWSKYTMLLIGPVFLWGLIFETLKGNPRNGLKNPWPYCGGIIALLVILPHLIWNANNDWITFKFQLRHGFALERPEMASSQLPVPEPVDPEGPEIALASEFEEIQQAQAEEELKPKPWDAILKKLNIYIGFYSSQVALWGLLLVPLVSAFWQRRKNRKDARAKFKSSPALGANAIVVAATSVPLIIFGLLSLASKVEANWAAMYVFGASALVTKFLGSYLKHPFKWGLINVALLTVVVVHANTGFLPLREHRDRIMAETHGYAQLAVITQKLKGPVFTDSYQTASMLRYYDRNQSVRQWPGITRDSEFLRRAELSDLDFAKLQEIGFFWLITNDKIPPKIKTFRPIEMTQLRDCKDGYIQVIRTSAAHDFEARCKSLIHEWYLLKYSLNEG